MGGRFVWWRTDLADEGLTQAVAPGGNTDEGSMTFYEDAH